MNSFMLGLADGPTEVHKSVVVKNMLKGVEPSTDQFPEYMADKSTARAGEIFNQQ